MHALLANRRCSVRQPGLTECHLLTRSGKMIVLQPLANTLQLQQLANSQAAAYLPGAREEVDRKNPQFSLLSLGLLHCSLDTVAGGCFLVFLAWLSSKLYPLVSYRSPFNKCCPLSLSHSSLGLVISYWSVCLMWLKNVKPNNALPLPDVSPWIPLVLSFDPIFTLANTFSHDMKANSKETDPKVIAFSFNPSSPKREETQHCKDKAIIAY